MPDFPNLDLLREELAAGLEKAVRASAPTEIDVTLAREAADSVLKGDGLPKPVSDLFGDRPVCTLVGFDADRIQSWVFDSERVQVAAGASETLDDLNQHVDGLIGRHGICGKLYSAGGGGMFFASARADRDELVNQTRGWLGERSHELTFTVVAEPLRSRDLGPSRVLRQVPAAGDLRLDRFQAVDGVRGALVRTQVGMRVAKDSSLQVGPPRVSAEPGEVRADRCSSCGRRPPRDPDRPATGTGPEHWCEWCQVMRKRLRKLAPGRFERHGQPITFAELAETVDRRRQYLGYVAIDGNSMGAVVQAVGGFLQLRAFSETTTCIYEAARKAVPGILEPYLKKGETAEECFLSLLSGGDEITLVLPAAAAPGVAVEVLRAVENGFDQACSPDSVLHRACNGDTDLLRRLGNLGAAAGVITAHANYPVRLLRRYASELQKEAKRNCAAHRHRSAVAWLLLTDSSPLTEGLESVAAEEDLSVTAFQRLLREAELAHEKRLPLTALHSVLGYCRQEERSLESLAGNGLRQVLNQLAANFFRYQMARNVPLRDWWQTLVSEEPSLTGDDEADSVARWFSRGGGRRLEQLVDLLSLEPFPEERA